MIYSFAIGLIRGRWIRCICLEPQGHGFQTLVGCGTQNQWLFSVWPNFNLINFVKLNPTF
jgi:hypothetical protein